MNKNIILGLVGVVIVIVVGFVFFTDDKMENSNEDKMEKKVEFEVKNMGEFARFFKKDLTDSERSELETIINNNEVGQKIDSAKNILRTASNNKDDMGSAFVKASTVMDEAKNILLPFIQEKFIGEYESI